MYDSESQEIHPLKSRYQPWFRGHKADCYLPIELLKNADYAAQLPSDHVFLSSGTTQSQRARSGFSTEGLATYEQTCIEGFHHILSQFFSQPEALAGYSLVPNMTQWPDSSLAHMVATLGGKWDLTYITVADCILPMDQPIWLFGTALHFAELCQYSSKIPLHPQSVIFETGGLKNATTKISRQELYYKISNTFQLSPNQIISEYGMCELASQAYDWVTPGTEKPLNLEQRYYRFPPWVDAFVCPDDQTFLSHGYGCLSLYDHRRTDIPMVIRTQDIVELHACGGFQIQSRVPYSTLKGCSSQVPFVLQSEASPAPKNVQLSTSPLTSQDITQKSRRYYKRAQQLQKLLSPLLASRAAYESLVTELQSPQIAKWAQDGLSTSLPQTPEAWVQLALHHCPDQTPDSILLIVPESHSIAGIEALLLSFICEIPLTIRRPWPEEQRNILDLLVTSLKPDHDIHILPASFRLTTHSPLPWQKVIVWGEDQTVKQLSHIVPKTQLVSFGSELHAIACDIDTALQDPASILYDAFSLSQRGCRSARSLLLYGAVSQAQLQDLQQQLTKLSYHVISGSQSKPQEIARAHESLQMRHHGAYCPNYTPEAGFFPIITKPSLLISSVPFVLPIYCLESLEQLISQAKALPFTHYICEPSLRMPGLTKPKGRGGWHCWNDLIKGKAYFG